MRAGLVLGRVVSDLGENPQRVNCGEEIGVLELRLEFSGLV